MDSADPIADKIKSGKEMDHGGDIVKMKGLYERYSYPPRMAKVSSATVGDFRGARVYISLYSMD